LILHHILLKYCEPQHSLTYPPTEIFLDLYLQNKYHHISFTMRFIRLSVVALPAAVFAAPAPAEGNLPGKTLAARDDAISSINHENIATLVKRDKCTEYCNGQYETCMAQGGISLTSSCNYVLTHCLHDNCGGKAKKATAGKREMPVGFGLL
jgi:hypothetical protein